MRLLVKIGGAQLEQPEARARLAAAVRSARAAGHQVALVHGGGRQMREWSRRLGLEERHHDGLRVTDADTAELALAVLGGLVNRQLVQALEAAAVRAVGLTGADGSCFAAARHRPGGHDLGFVGHVHEVDTALLDLLLETGTVPVLASVAPLAQGAEGDRSRFYNINADMAAGPLAAALDADALLFLTDVPGVRGRGGEHLSVLTPRACEQLRRDGALEGGMLPKVQAALRAVEGRPGLRVVIANADGEDAVLAALEPSAGTSFAPDSEEETHG